MLAAEAPPSDQVAFAERCERIRWRLLAQNLGFTVTSLIGIYRHRADLRATAGAVAQLARRNFSLPIR